METKNIADLKANAKNPRTISKHDFEALKKSIQTFGDLSGIVYNIQTQQLVGGHQRTEAFKAIAGDKRINITQRYETPNKQGTVALGYVTLDNEQFGYREVDWTPEFEASANIAANRIQGQFDIDLLAQVNYELSQLENGQDLLALTGQTNDEIDKLVNNVANVKTKSTKDNNKVTFTLLPNQLETVEEALGHIKATREMATEQNTSLNGNALYYMSKDYLDRLHGTEPTTPIESIT